MSVALKRPEGLIKCAARLHAPSRAQASSPLRRQQLRTAVTLPELNKDRDESGRKRVVILGSGWAGYTIARRLDPRKFQVVIVSPRSYFVFTPLLASTSVGTLEFRTALEPVRSRRNKFDFFQGWADDVSFKDKTISIEEAVADPRQSLALTAGDAQEVKNEQEEKKEDIEKTRKGKLFEMKYDKLIVAVGCYSQTFGTPGVKENALFLKDVGDARRIRNRLLTCFETAALPTTTPEMRKCLLNFAIVGGGPTGIEFSAELHDIITEDLARIYPQLMPYYNVTVYDVAPTVLSMFDEKLSKYAISTLSREGVHIRTSHHVESLRRGPPEQYKDQMKDGLSCWTLKLKEEGEIGVGMVVWSTGLMMNPFVQKALDGVQQMPVEGITWGRSKIGAGNERWKVMKNEKTGGVVTDDKLRVLLHPEGGSGEKVERAVMEDVFAVGDCAQTLDTLYPATAQVASQKGEWLAKHLNDDDIATTKGFHWKNMGVMAYLGNWNAILSSEQGNISGRVAWFIWRGAYLTKAVSWRNKLLIPMYWAINWLFGRDISRF
ncbi:pyridine nucleotide-disulfide oxidoreductase-like protein [Aulographum hederae CBS 113979]|uniref:Pyridine nucleotide-disulfide oxidoreductase-like protein n=1 Tax=Aulographum hederae CBS 113979 TaxID=1176131 RepID=A0A6G1GTZ4_9PEZI|nr:pyridine nucleotide-disulfide oxidoreductase-like protein [Aulographum hederae CBS 113979]